MNESIYDRGPGPSVHPPSLTAAEHGLKDFIKMALKELGAQLAGPISVRVAPDDSQFS